MDVSMKKLLEIVWKNIIFIAVVSVVFASCFFCYTKFAMPKKYVSKISFTVVSTASDTNVANPSYLNSNLLYTRSIVKSKVTMLATNDYYLLVADQLNKDIDQLILENPEHAQELEASKKTAAQIGAAISFSIIEETELFTIKVVTNSMSESKMIADAIEKTANARLMELSVNSDMLEGEYPVTDSVKCYEKPLMGKFAGPSVGRNTIVGFMLGFVLAFALAFMRDITDVRVKSVSDLTDKYDIPVLGTVVSFDPAKR